MRKILIILVLLAACNSTPENKKYYLKITHYENNLLSQEGVTKLDSVFAPNYFAAYDSLVVKALSINFANKISGEDSSLRNYDLYDGKMNLIYTEIPDHYKDSIKNVYYQTYQKLIKDLIKEHPEIYKKAILNY